ncbi:MAG: HAD-IC family P-type ATPase [Patescibacteria group bacterium]|nr:HAD-IC family P-type ATPase [Patescibacteria group bacterium]
MGGLTAAEHQIRLAQYGPNRLEERRQHILNKILKWFVSPIALMLIVAAALSLFIGHVGDAYFILVLIVLNISVSFWHEHKADKAIEELRSKLSVRVRVLRDGAWQDADAESLVPGDVIECTVGDLVPADAVVIDAKNVLINESVVTGESMPKEKESGATLYSGSVVAAGVLKAQVAKTGNATYFGSIIASSKPASRTSGLERDILAISRYLLVASLVAVMLLTTVLAVRHVALVDILLLDLSLLIAGLPVSLPTVMTLIISTGALLLAQRQALVRRLAALEDLANVDLLLTDKTGTLTESNIVVESMRAYAPWRGADIIALTATAVSQNPRNLLNHAVVEYANMHHIETGKLISSIPGDSSRKRTTAVVELSGKTYLVSSGTPPVIKGLVRAGKYESFERDVEIAASGGSRVIAIAVRSNAAHESEEYDMELAGIIVLSDPLRSDAPDIVRFLGDEGIAVKMVTGDTIATARRVAEQLSLQGEVLNCRERAVMGAISDEVFNRTGTFAEVLPEDKLALVKMARASGRILAVTGDGVNDLPAIRNADVGIAVANAVDALKAVADIVLLSHGISVIRDALIEARNIFARLSSYATYRISESFRLVVTVLVLGFLYADFPLTPVQLLLLALLNDIPIISLAFNRVKRSSRPADLHSKERFVAGTLFGLVGVANSLLLFFVMTQWLHLSWPLIQAAFFLKLAVSGHMLIYVAHTKARWWKFLPSGTVIAATTITQLIATSLVFFGIVVPALSLPLILFVWVWAFFWMQISELVKPLQHVFLFEQKKPF